MTGSTSRKTPRRAMSNTSFVSGCNTATGIGLSQRWMTKHARPLETLKSITQHTQMSPSRLVGGPAGAGDRARHRPPEVATAVTALASGQHDLGVGTTFSSGVFNLADLFGRGAPVAGSIACARGALLLP